MKQDTNRGQVLLVATLASFLTPFMGSSINLAIPTLASEFKASAIMLNWVVISYLLASAAFLLPFGRLADISGRKRVLTAGVCTYTLFSLACALAPSVELLIAFRLLQGIGSAMIFGTAMAIITSAFPPAERGKVLGIATAAVYAGLSAGRSWGAFSSTTPAGEPSSS